MIEITPCSSQGDFKTALVKDFTDWLILDLSFQDIHKKLSIKKIVLFKFLTSPGKLNTKECRVF